MVWNKSAIKTPPLLRRVRDDETQSKITAGEPAVNGTELNFHVTFKIVINA